MLQSEPKASCYGIANMPSPGSSKAQQFVTICRKACWQCDNISEPLHIGNLCPASKMASISEQQLSNLHSIQRRTLADLVAAHKQVQASCIRPRDVAAHAAHDDVVTM